MEIKTAEYTYSVVDDQTVTIKINSGDGSLLRAVDVILKDNGVIADQVNQVNNLPIGLGHDIRGRTLRTLSLVSDVTNLTNRTSVTYNVRGGVQNLNENLSETVDDFGTVLYIADFIFE